MKNSFITIRGLTYSALFAAILVVLSFITIPVGFSPVPVTLQNFAVMLAGGLLGARYGLISIGSVVVLCALGFPLLHGTGGPGLVFGPTGGFIWSFPIAAFLIGFIAAKLPVRGIAAYVLHALVSFLFGSLLLYIPGVPWLAYVADLSIGETLVVGMYPYLPGDLLKAAAAGLIIPAIRAVFPLDRLLRGKDKVVQVDSASTDASPGKR
ncbi:biotin transporter BioY [Paenibacillus senegalensis]|uniref:biotin transporter BioY n=1 Tax=Paenibacillus senegalensis TaxID=1465766 RepID=UPI00028833EA|nr:biotin transporter BioY [Paenibacillus senegalensis]